MSKRLRFPIRLKILASLLFLVTGVVGVITFKMASLFHDDKKAYINDLVSMVALSTAEESHSVLAGYVERVRVYHRLIANEDLSREQKAKLLQELFQDFPELVAVEVDQGDGEDSAAFNSAALEAAGLSKEDLRREQATHPLPLERIRQGEIYVRNSTLSTELPTLTLAAAPAGVGPDDETVVSAVIRLETLGRLAERSGAFEVFLADSDGVLLAHRDPGLVVRRQAAEHGTELAEARGEYSAGVTLEVEREGQPMIVSFARADLGGVVAGARIPKAVAFLASRDLLDQLLVVALVLLAAATLAGLFWARRITRPVEQLSGATREIAKGHFETRLRVESRDEMGELAQSFNQMATELKDREDALQEAQQQLVQSEKMAAFGQLGAGIAHEVKNPLAGILGCAQLSLRKADADNPLHKNLKLIEKETKRCKTIIENLLKFARQEKAIYQPVRVNSVVDDAVAIVNHQLEMHKITLERDTSDDLPPIKGNANQLQQVLMNLMINAQQAMEGEPGTVRVSTRRVDPGHVEIRVADTGPGIAEEVQEKIFEPFVTTKPGGKGTGLGLSVSYGIIKDHGGEIVPERQPGEGAEFVITLPVLEDSSPDAVSA
jgi:signal transduction histidine kinase